MIVYQKSFHSHGNESHDAPKIKPRCITTKGEQKHRRGIAVSTKFLPFLMVMPFVVVWLAVVRRSASSLFAFHIVSSPPASHIAPTQKSRVELDRCQTPQKSPRRALNDNSKSTLVYHHHHAARTLQTHQ